MTQGRKKKSRSGLGEAAAALAVLSVPWFLFDTPVGHAVALVLMWVAAVVAASVVSMKSARRRECAERQRAIDISLVDSMSGWAFERYVAELLGSRGFRAMATRGSNDFGVDVVASRDGVSYAVQCKRNAAPVSRHAVSDAVAGAAYYKCSKAMVVTNSRFTPGAMKLAESNQCVLVDRDVLARWISERQASG